MDNNIQTISKIIVALRGLFKDKDRLVGVEDWDTFIGVLMLLEEVGENLRSLQEEQNQTEG